eukprot:TRINITY_DN1913_c0_g2_i3.p1 TRINITY_DN1913_c0_g2~~TRINITY_DN1913_c0_g2_i3.p1  ORF type:complete len:108 (+),score=14.75 TRINITY_DN1913_c0_g2_i3:40-363(+)
MDPILSSLAPFLQLSGHTPREALIKAENLDLVHKSMTSAPESIGQLTNLKMLLIHNNELSSLPISIGKLERLTRLSVEQNRLSSLPAESIGKLKNLTQLNLHNNQVS